MCARYLITATYCFTLNKFSGIFEVSSNVLHQSSLSLLTQYLAPECTHLREVVVICCVEALCITSYLKEGGGGVGGGGGGGGGGRGGGGLSFLLPTPLFIYQHTTTILERAWEGWFIGAR